MSILKVFADESSQNKHRFLVLGLVAYDATSEQDVYEKLASARLAAHFGREIKWGKVSRAKFPGYELFVNAFFELAALDKLHFHALHVDTRTFKNSQFGDRTEEMGFHKLIYQLLLHKIGRFYGKHYPCEVYLDKRVSRRDPNEMTPMLNAALRRDWGIKSNPFCFVEFLDSGESDLLQLVDVLVGAIAYRKNEHDLRPDASPARIALARHIASSVVQLRRQGDPATRAHRFTVWPFCYKERA